MVKLTSIVGATLLPGSSWFAGEMLPRFTHTAAVYVMLPICGFLVTIAAAYCAVRLLPVTDRR